MKNIKKTLLNSKQASGYLSIPLRTLQHLSKQGKIKAIKIGKYWKYKKSDIEQYLLYGTDFSQEPDRKPDNFIERRASSRINTNFECQYSISLPPFKNINNEAIIKNLSAGGILLSGKNEEMNNIEIDDPINLKFTLIDKDKIIAIETAGKIIRMDRNKLGIKFRNIDKSYQDLLIGYVG